jgi:hypothetical protein
MADGELCCAAFSECNECRQVIYNRYDCLKCQELSNKLQIAIDEVSSLQLINKLLIKDLEKATTKNEVKNRQSAKLKLPESQDGWISVGTRKKDKLTGRDEELNVNYTPQFHTITNNRCDALSNQRDDVASEIHDQSSLRWLKNTHQNKKKLKISIIYGITRWYQKM